MSRPAEAGRNRPTRRRQSWADVAFFAATFLAGTAAIITLKHQGWPQLQVTAAPVLILAAYAFAVAFIPFFRLREDRAGDACYYLGFLFTLVSLSSALVEFARETRNIEALVGDFGIALGTTMAGLLLRVLFAQMRVDPVEIEREARVALTEAVARLRAELDNGVVELQSFRRAAQQSFADLTNELVEQQSSLLTRQGEAIAASVKGAAEQIDRMAGALGQAGQSLDQNLQPLATGVERLTSRVAALEAPLQALQEVAATAARAVDAMPGIVAGIEAGEARRAASLDKLVAGLQPAIAGIEQAGQRAGERLAGLEHGAAALERIDKAADRVTAALEGVTETGRSHAAELGAVRDRCQQVSTALARITAETQSVVHEHDARLKADLEGARELVARFENGLVAFVDRLTGQIQAGNGRSERGARW